LAGFAADAEVDPGLHEWDDGRHEGRTSAEIHAGRPDWQLFRDGYPGGESAEQIGVRADRLVNRVGGVGGDVLLFSSGHFLRASRRPTAPFEERAMTRYVSKRAAVNGVNLHYIVAGEGPVVLGMHGWPQNHREFLPAIDNLAGRYRFIAPDLRGFADSDKPFSGYEPKTIARDMLELLAAEGVDAFHILSHDLGGPPSVALAYLAGDRARSLATIETPFFGLDSPGYVDPRVPYWHHGMHMNMDITAFLVEGREDRYLRHFFRDFAYNPEAIPEEEVARYVAQMRQPGNLRASLNHYGYIPQMAEQTAELTREKLGVPMLAWGGVRSFGTHCIDCAKAIAVRAEGGVIAECGHWVFEEKTHFICEQLANFWPRHGGSR
jgi:pimeloyl-ACP methyl ester carboxylesterase